MRSTRHTFLTFAAALLILAVPGLLVAGSSRTASTTPIVTALTSPVDGSTIPASERPTFAFDATPGGRFRVQWSSTRTPFIPMLDSGRRTTPGDQLKPNVPLWRAILDLGAGTNVVYWRVIALHMTQAEMDAAPIASFTIQR